MFKRISISGLALATLLCGCAASEERTATTDTSSAPSTSLSTSTTLLPPTAEVPDNAIRVSFIAGSVDPAPGRRRVQAGDTATIVVTSDVAEEVHLHGYEKTLDLRPGVPATLTFIANIPGVFEAELHGSGKRLFELEVAG